MLIFLVFNTGFSKNFPQKTTYKMIQSKIYIYNFLIIKQIKQHTFIQIVTELLLTLLQSKYKLF